MKSLSIFVAAFVVASAFAAERGIVITDKPQGKTVDAGESVTFSVKAKNYVGYTLPLSSDIALEMAYCPPGTFKMGSPTDETGRGDNETQHTVVLTHGFWIGRYEVRQKEYMEVMEKIDSSFNGDELPEDAMSWQDAEHFSERVTASEQKAGRLPKGHLYSLPTEAQWEYACRAGTDTALNSGKGLSEGDAQPNMEEVGWFASNSSNKTHIVGQKLPNAWGMYDMHGNVSEWCWDWYKAEYPVGVVTNPAGPSLPVDGGCVLRGGSWKTAAQQCRSAARSQDQTTHGGPQQGFRLALVRDRGISVPLSDDVEMKMLWVDSGTFTMGSPANELGRQNDETQHSVTLTQPFWIGRCEVSQSAYQAVMGEMPAKFNKEHGVDDDLPVYWVSRDEALEFCQKLTERERAAGRMPAGYRFALPTEAQWEYACRGRTSTALNNSCNLTATNRCPNVDRVAWYLYNGNGWVRSGAKEPGDGFHFETTIGNSHPEDMHGNVREWVADRYGAYPSEAVTDPTGPETGDVYILRGGGINDEAWQCRSAMRIKSDGSAESTSGFRVAIVQVDGVAADPDELYPVEEPSIFSEGMSYQWYKDGEAIAGATSSNLTISAAKSEDAGRYTVDVWCQGVTNCAAAELTVKAITASVTGYEGVYDGLGHDVKVAVTEPDGCKVAFALGDSSGPTDEWCDESPIFTNVCDVTVWVELSAEGYPTATNSAVVKITPRDIAGASFPSIPAQFYDGVPIEPTPTNVLCGALQPIADADYSIAWVSNNAPGTAVVMLTGQGNYSGTNRVEFSILPQLTASLRWKYTRNANGWFCAQVAIPWYAGYNDALTNVRLLCEDRHEFGVSRGAFLILDEERAEFFQTPQMIMLEARDRHYEDNIYVEDIDYYYMNAETGDIYSEKFLQSGYKNVITNTVVTNIETTVVTNIVITNVETVVTNIETSVVTNIATVGDPNYLTGKQVGTSSTFASNKPSHYFDEYGVINRNGEGFHENVTVDGTNVEVKLTTKCHEWLTAYLVDPATAIDPMDKTEAYKGTTYRVSPIDVSSFTNLDAGARAVYGVKDETLASLSASVSEAEQKICLCVASRGITKAEQLAEMDVWLACDVVGDKTKYIRLAFEPPSLPAVTDVTVRQKWAESAVVDISFGVTNSPALWCPDWNAPCLSIVATDNETGSNYVAAASALSGNTGPDDGEHAVTWDMTGLIPDGYRYTNMTFKVAYLKMPDYCVIDLSGRGTGNGESGYAVSYLDSEPDGGFTNYLCKSDLYKTDCLAMRLVESESARPFYCAVFETTQRQWELVKGDRPSYFTNDLYYATLPVEQVSYDMIRGKAQTYDWPTTNAVDESSFVGVLRQKTGISSIDLPTEAQWEYACRAGTTTAYSYGDSPNGEYMWYDGNSSNETHEVGTRLPNGLGLYDMHGNVWEWCLDRYSKSARVAHGGSWRQDAAKCTSLYQNNAATFQGYRNLGFRLVRALSGNTEAERSNETVSGTERAGTVCAGTSAKVMVDLRPPEVKDVSAEALNTKKIALSFTVTRDMTEWAPAGNAPYLSIVATDNETGSNYVSKASALSGDTSMAEGAHSVVWDMRSQGVRFASSNVTFTVAYLNISDNPEIEDAICAGASAAIEFGLPPVISNVVARQRWPWNGLVDIDYEIAGRTEDLELVIVVSDAANGTNWTARTFLEGFEPSTAPGRHRATWNARADVGEGVVASVAVAVKLVEEFAYSQYDFSGFPAAKITSSNFLTDNKAVSAFLEDSFSKAAQGATDTIEFPNVSCFFQHSDNDGDEGAALSAEGRAVLDTFATCLAMTDWENVHVLVEGYTCDIGSVSDNDELSQRRAETVKAEIAKHIPASKITAKWYGKRMFKNFKYDTKAEYDRVNIRLQ